MQSMHSIPGALLIASFSVACAPINFSTVDQLSTAKVSSDGPPATVAEEPSEFPPPPPPPPPITPANPVVPLAKDTCPSQVMRYEFAPPMYPQAGYCEGIVNFVPDVSTGRYAPWVTEAVGYIGMQYSSMPKDPSASMFDVGADPEANGGTDFTWIEQGEYPYIHLVKVRSTTPHNGKGYLVGRPYPFTSCSIMAKCVNGVATALGMSW